MFMTTIDYFADREHGSKHCKVPSAWRAQHRLHSVYSLSSFMFCVTGMFMMALLHAYPWNSLYHLHMCEGIYWMWTGFISFACDAVDLGIPSWSHPIDRLSATLFVLYNVVQYLVFLGLGSLPIAAAILFPVGLSSSLWFFWLGSKAVHRKEMKAYFYWHTAWHYTLSIAFIVYFTLVFFAGDNFV